MSDSFMEEVEKRQEEFLQGWDWDRVFEEWKRTIQRFGVELDLLFTDILIHDPENQDGRPSVYSWWPKSEVQELHLNLQYHFDTWPKTRANFGPRYQLLTGALDTLMYLWKAKASEEAICAVLISASIFSRLHGTQSRYPDGYWPAPVAAMAVDKLAYSYLTAAESVGFHGWHHSCTVVLPKTSVDFQYKVKTIDALIRYFAEEHASMLLTVDPVRVVFSDKKDPFIAKALQQEKEQREKQQEKLQLQRAADEKAREEQREEKKQEIEKLREKHPRFGEFFNLSNRELEFLVWSKPMTLIAAEFGVSDVAIGKRCKAKMITKPPRGFWLKVKSGKLPHPNGKPTHVKNRIR